jgi:ABC-type thiamine transport system ATPase subunit
MPPQQSQGLLDRLDQLFGFGAHRQGILDWRREPSLRRSRCKRAPSRASERSAGLTTVVLTHDQGEAMDLADRVALLNAGRIEQVGPPHELSQTPATPFVREFLA